MLHDDRQLYDNNNLNDQSEKEIFDVKMFRLFKDIGSPEVRRENEGDESPPLQQYFSLNDFYELDQKKLENKVVVMYSSPENLDDEETLNSTKFYQIKRQHIVLDKSDYKSLTFYDVSSAIRFQQLIGEKRLLESINALVSHEMRNPLNSINAIILRVFSLLETL